MMLNSSGEGRSSEEVQTEVNQLKMQAEETKKEVEDLKTALEEKRLQAEETNKEVEDLKAALDGRKEELEERNRELEEMKSELQELNNLLEEKSRETDESMDKYCSLMVEFHKLEETNDALTTRLEQITATKHTKEANVHSSSSDSRRRSARKSVSKHQEIKLEDNAENMAPSTPQRSPQGSSSGKRGHRDMSDKDSAQEALHNLTKKIRANTVTTPKPKTQQEDEEFRPEGLPELVQRGFADIPLGEASPFIMRRTTVKRCSPRLAAKQTCTTSAASTSGSDSKVLGSLSLQSPSTGTTADSANRKRLSPSSPEKPPRRSLSLRKTPEQKEKLLREETQQGDNCHVQ